MNRFFLQSFRLKNFKAVRDSGTIHFTPLTVFIGNNGSGKSSIIEGLETLHIAVTQDLDHAMHEWKGFEHILNKAVPHDKLVRKPDSRPYYENPMSFDLKGKLEGLVDTRYMLEIAKGEEKDANDLFIRQEKLTEKMRSTSRLNFLRNDSNRVVGSNTIEGFEETVNTALLAEKLLLNLRSNSPLTSYDFWLKVFIEEWQFVALIPQFMGNPIPQRRTGGYVALEKDGSNIAEYLLDIKNASPSILEGIISSLQHILPYSLDLQVEPTSELERTIYLQLTEGKFQVPGWLLSTGTLRIVALLALLRHPEPPPLIVIEEIENGLDPNSVRLIIDEIRSAVESGRTQIIMTTHSPFLLDLLDLSHIVLVERVDGQPTFTRPGDRNDLQKWAERFAPGQLYRMGKLSGAKEE